VIHTWEQPKHSMKQHWEGAFVGMRICGLLFGHLSSAEDGGLPCRRHEQSGMDRKHGLEAQELRAWFLWTSTTMGWGMVYGIMPSIRPLVEPLRGGNVLQSGRVPGFTKAKMKRNGETTMTKHKIGWPDRRGCERPLLRGKA